MKRFVAAAIAAVVLSVGVTACGGGSGGSSQDAFCGMVRDNQSKLGNTPALTNPSALSDYQKLLTDLRSKAPSEIKGDLTVVADALDQFFKKGAIPDPAKIQAAVANLNTYAKDKCGVDLSAAAASAGSAASSASGSGSGQAAGDAQLCTDLGSVGIGATSNPKAAVERLKQVNPPAELKDVWSDFVAGAEAYANGNLGNAQVLQKYVTAASKVGQYVTSNCAGLASQLSSFADEESSSS